MDTKECIINIISKLTKNENAKSYLYEGGDIRQVILNSMEFIRIVVELEEVFNIEFDDYALDYDRFTTINDLCEYVEHISKYRDA